MARQMVGWIDNSTDKSRCTFGRAFYDLDRHKSNKNAQYLFYFISSFSFYYQYFNETRINRRKVSTGTRIRQRTELKKIAE